MLAYSLLISRFLKVGAFCSTLLQKKNMELEKEIRALVFCP